jgi:probable HAF family extracellular repeat protein
MRYPNLVLIAAAALGGCGKETEVTRPVAALSQPKPELHYSVSPLPPAGPGTSQGGGINNQGWVAGFTGTSAGSRHAALWQDGVLTDLGSLGGATSRSAVQWPGINNQGVIVGISQTGDPEPLNEDWSCAPFLAAVGQTCLGFVWLSGTMTPLPTLGGHNGFAAGVNGRGQVVGWAETAVVDPTCNLPQVLQFRAVMWEPAAGRKTELKPYPGDSTSAATAINERGQAVGISGECDVAVGRRSALRAVLWDTDGTMKVLGDLGGPGWHTPMAINNRGDVVGFSNPPDGDVDGDSLRAFLWTKEEGIQDLGRLPGDESSQALGINSRGLVVGVSCAAACRAVVWQDGKIQLLKDLAGPDLPDDIWSARYVNDAGQITGRLRDHVTGQFVSFVATPIAPTP